MLTPYRAYMLMMAKIAADSSLDDVVEHLPEPAREVLDKPVVREVVDPTKKPLYRISGHLNEHKGDIAKATTSNVLYGLLSNPRGNGPVSLTGASVGGVIDGLLFKPTVDAGIGLVGKGLRAASRLKSEP